jgi:hypothetical protein
MENVYMTLAIGGTVSMCMAAAVFFAKYEAEYESAPADHAEFAEWYD